MMMAVIKSNIFFSFFFYAWYQAISTLIYTQCQRRLVSLLNWPIRMDFPIMQRHRLLSKTLPKQVEGGANYYIFPVWIPGLLCLYSHWDWPIEDYKQTTKHGTRNNRKHFNIKVQESTQGMCNKLKCAPVISMESKLMKDLKPSGYLYDRAIYKLVWPRTLLLTYETQSKSACLCCREVRWRETRVFLWLIFTGPSSFLEAHLQSKSWRR